MSVTGIPVTIVPSGGLPVTDAGERGVAATQVPSGGLPVTLATFGMPISFGVIQITTPAYLDPAKMRVGDVIGSAFTAGVYPDFQGNPVVETSVAYTVDSAPVLASYVLQAGDVVGQAEVTLSATGATDRVYFSEIAGVTDFSFTPTGLEWVVPSGVDATAPVLSSPVGTKTGQTTANGGVTTDEGNGTLYMVTTGAATAPTAAQVKAGQDHAGAAAAFAASQAVASIGAKTFSVTGLTAGTTYYNHYMHEDAATNQSTVATSASFTTDAADTTAPVLSSPVDAANGALAATGSVSTDEGNGTLYWVVSTSGTAPTKAQVKAGQNHTGASAADAGSQAVSATGVQTLSPAPSGLTASTAYTIHFMHEDAATNQSTVASGDGFTTAAASGPTLITDGNLIDTSAPGTTPAILGSITAQAGDMIVILLGTCRNTGGSAMAVSAAWNGEAFTENVQLLHSGGRATSHVLTLVTASAGTFTPVVTCSNSAAAVGADYFVIRGQSGTPIKQSDSNATTSGTVCAQTLPTPNTGAIILAGACQRFSSTSNPSSMTVAAPFTQDSNFRTGTTNNLDMIFSAGHYVTPDGSNVTATFTSDAAQNITLTIMEIF